MWGFRRYLWHSDKILRGYWQLLQIVYVCQSIASTLLSLPEGIYYLQSSWQRLLDNFYRYLQEGCPINKQCSLMALLLRNLKVKIKIQEATGRFELTEFYLLIKLFPPTVPDRRG
jgi:hypothetical protein